MPMADAVLASFETKGALAHPELPLMLRFAPPSQHALLSAFACLSFELAHTAFEIAENEVANSKLHWWAEELAAIPTGTPRHPLSKVLAECEAVRALPEQIWIALIHAALGQRDPAPASTQADLLAGYARFYAALALVETRIVVQLEVDALAQADALCRTLRETLRLPESLGRGSLPLPLDLMARHQLSRNELIQSGEARDAALREHFANLAAAMRMIDRSGLSTRATIRLHADLVRCMRAARATDPLALASGNPDRLPLSSVWAGWRSSRRLQASR